MPKNAKFSAKKKFEKFSRSDYYPFHWNPNCKYVKKLQNLSFRPELKPRQDNKIQHDEW